MQKYHMHKVMERGEESGEREGELKAEEREKDSQPIEPCLDVLTHTHTSTQIHICMYSVSVCRMRQAK